ncbi:BamA/TamA family outer membrane protein [Geomesophilobacter sediminis]|uniref:PD40 domain-containing protein n=1 Tax=Geomesophilobacter sediminis TaxID=2798584 RepID=A0A8J7IZH0_9BACT|nr:BamA/TamA family outer membrane protein [Geomesophilobacter sediminis]MBJ6723508.1 PD40 domain-containing protein [Geomesophilobacter sediminis]
MKSVVLAILLVLSAASLSFAAVMDTSFKFSTIETSHFSIHFHQGLEPAARKVAATAEGIHPKMVREFKWEPQEKTQVVLIDDTDFENGMTITIPYNMIILQVVPPSLVSSIGEYDDWLKVLITHEYAHVLTADAARGYSKVTRSIFGKPLPSIDPLSELLFFVTAPPNTFNPRWWHEGMATWAETEFTGAGRGRASDFDMIYRMAVAENNIPSIDRINGELPDWPDGNLPYVYGYRLQQYIADTYGKEALGTLSLEQAGRFPYFINAPPERLTNGKDFAQLYRDMVQQMFREQDARIVLLSRAPYTPLRLVSNEGENLTFPRVSPDGSRIAFNRNDPHDHPTVVIADRQGNRVMEFRRVQSDRGSLTWAPDGNTIYFSQAEVTNGFDIFQDLYAFDLNTKSTSRLTKGLRLHDVDLSPDGTTFAAVVSNRGSQNLVLLDRADVTAYSRVTPRQATDLQMQRVSAPRWSPDGRSIAYTVTDNAGHTGIHLYNVVSGTDRAALTLDHNVAFPVWTRDGGALIYVSDETGVFNLFAYDLKEKKSYQVTHLLGGALHPEVAPDGKSILLASYTSRGYSIVSTDLDRGKWSEQRGPTLPPPRQLNQALPPGTPEPVPPQTPEAKPYSPWKTLYPHFWLPHMTFDGSDMPPLGIFTAGQDVLGYNTFLLSADYSTGRNRAYYDLTYLNNYFYPTILLQGYAQPFLYGDLLQRGGDYYELNRAFKAEVSVPVNFIESNYRVKGGYWLQDQRALSSLDPNGRFRGIDVFQGRRDSFYAGVDYASNLRYPYSISSEEGRLVSAQVRRYQRGLGSDVNSTEYSASYSEFLRMPSPALKHHVLYVNLAGAAAKGDLTPQQALTVGGVPSDLNPYSVRGYADRSALGRYLAKGTLEYRLPVSNLMSGPGTAPLFLEKFHTAVFVDAAHVWDDHITNLGDRTLVGAGGELRLDVSIGYWLTITPALGVAHGFGSGGENTIYLTIYANL